MLTLHWVLTQIVVEIPPIPPLPPLPDFSQFPQAPPVPSGFPPELMAWLNTMSPEMLLIPVVLGLAIAGSVVFLLVRALARRIEGRGGKAIQAELAALHERIADLESGHQRIAELEERLDFSERMLVQDTRRGAGGVPRAIG